VDDLRDDAAPRSGLGRLTHLATADVALAAVVVLGCFALWSANDAGYEEILWYPVALLVVLLGAILAWSAPERPLGTAATWAVAALAAYTAWAFLSLLWAEDRGLALTGANRTLLYLAVFAVVLRRRWQGLDALTTLLCSSAITVAAGCVVLVRAHDAAHDGAFLFGRFSSPVAYANANSALFVVAAWPSVAAFTDRRLPWPVRAFALGLATAAVELALLGQSKGAALGVAATLVFVVAVVRDRARFLVPVLVVGAAVAVFHRPLFDVYSRASDGGDIHRLARDAFVALAISSGCAALAGAAIATLGDVWARRSPDHARRAGIVLLTATVLGAIAVLGVVAAHYGGPRETVHRAWHAFAHPPKGSDSSSHFTSATGNNRYDYWRVAAHQFRSRPLTGVGIDNFGADYVKERRSQQEPAYPHSLEARLLGGTGLVGFVVFFVFLGAAAWIVVAAARSQTEMSALGLAATGMLAYWFAHGSVDWLWEFPGVTCPVFVAVAACARPAITGGRGTARVERTFLTVGAVGAAAAAVILLPSWIAARDVASASSSWRSDPSGAYSKLDQAAVLNRVSDQPYLVAGTIAERRREWSAAATDFEKAIGRNDPSWYSHLELGIALAKLGRQAEALPHLERARALNPRDPLVRETLADVRAHRPVRSDLLDKEFIARTPVGAAG
jgi:O-Antigen ligase